MTHRSLTGVAREAAADVASTAAGAALASLSAVRRGKGVHPHGEVREAVLRISGEPGVAHGSCLLATAGEHAAVARFSRSIGMPWPLPDLFGCAVRVLDAYGTRRHQDLLMITSVDRPVLHHLFVPALRPTDRPYSSSAPYRAAGERFLVGLLPRSADRYDLAVAPLDGRFTPVGTLELGAVLPDSADALRFTPFNSGGGLEPFGAVNRLRRRAYPMSQAAWGATRAGARDRQRAAERLVEAVPAAQRAR